MNTTTADSAGVRLPPPLIYLAGLLAGGLLSVWMPSAWLPLAISRAAGGLLVAAGVALAASALSLFRRLGTTPRPYKPVFALASRGPYRFTRNPMYLGLAILYAGIAILLQSLWALLLLPLVLFVIQRRVIAREEAYLERRFGADYVAYKSRVRRWI